MLQQKKKPHLSIFAWCKLRKAINMNSAKHVQSALIAAPRKRRATWMLKVTVPRSEGTLIVVHYDQKGSFLIGKPR